MLSIRTTLRVGAGVFALSALLLLGVPGFFLDLLMLDADSAPLQWAMRMIGLILVALAGLMAIVSTAVSDRGLMAAGIVMAVVATGLGVLTLLIPAPLGWFSLVYAAVGGAFGLNYLICLLRRRVT